MSISEALAVTLTWDYLQAMRLFLRRNMKCWFHHRETLALGLMLWVTDGAGAAKEPTVEVGANVWVSKAMTTVPHAEVVIAADPTRPERLLAASMAALERTAKDESRVIVYGSSDGGQTWSVSFEPHARADPALSFTPDGAAYLAAIAPEGEDFFRVLVFRHADPEKPWERLTGGDRIVLDRPHIAAGGGGSKRRIVYLSGTGGGQTLKSNHRPAVYRSEDGLNFKLLHAWDPDHTQGADNFGNGMLTVLSDGTVVTSYPCSPLSEWKDSIKPVLSAGWKVGLQPTGEEVLIRVRRV